MGQTTPRRQNQELRCGLTTNAEMLCSNSPVRAHRPTRPERPSGQAKTPAAQCYLRKLCQQISRLLAGVSHQRLRVHQMSHLLRCQRPQSRYSPSPTRCETKEVSRRLADSSCARDRYRMDETRSGSVSAVAGMSRARSGDCGRAIYRVIFQ